MKTFVSLLIVYIAVCIGGSLAGASFYMIYQSLRLFIVGQQLSLFSSYLFYRGILFVFPFVCASASLFMVLYLVRHPGGVVLPLVAYVLTGCLSWLYFIPLSLSQTAALENAAAVKKMEQVVSPGYFREDSGGVYYYTRVSPDGFADGLYIDLSGFSGEQGKILKLEATPVNAAAAGPFADLLIRDAVMLPRIIRIPVSFYQAQLRAGRSAYQSGSFAWICFASVGIALLSVFALQLMSDWRLLNAFLLIAVFFLVGMMNGSYYGGSFFTLGAARFTEWWRAVSTGLPSSLGCLKTLHDPFIIFLNGAISIVFILLGTGVALLRKIHPDTRDEKADL